MLARFRKQIHRASLRGVGLGLIFALGVYFLMSGEGMLKGLEDWMLDGCFAWRGQRPTRARVVLIAIDEETLDSLHKSYAYISPELAEVVRYVNRHGAAAVGLDLIVPETMSTLPQIATPGAAGDAAPLGKLIRDSGNVVLSCHREKTYWRRPLLQWQLKALNPLRSEPTDLCFVNLTEDDDQIVRRQQLLLRDGDGAMPHFALALYAKAHRIPIAWEDDGTPRLGELRVPLDEEGKLRIDYAGPAGTFRPLPFHKVLEAARAGKPMPEADGAVVLIGVTAPGLQDYHPTPYSNLNARLLPGGQTAQMPGTEIHANILATLEDRAFVSTPVWLRPLPLLLGFGALLGFAFAQLSLIQGLGVALLYHAGLRMAALASFTVFHWRLELVGLLLLGWLVYGATFAVRWWTLRRMFGTMKSEAVARALESDPNKLDPGGEERTITVLFADLRDFTSFSEAHTPHEVVRLLNAYFDAVVPLIEAEGGVVDKYMGDGLMVLFGAPASCPDHALRAARAAVAMVRRVHELRAEWARLGFPGMRIGVGVNTGSAVVGAIGSRRRLDFTAIGDTVNAAARIESENKGQGTEVLLSASTYAALPEKEADHLGCEVKPRCVHVKGKKDELLLHAISVV